MLDFLFVEELRDTRENAEVWQEWAHLRDRLTNSLFASAALAPMLVVTYVIGEIYWSEVREFPGFIRVILVEAVICRAVLSRNAANFIRCSVFKGWLMRNGRI